MFFCRRCRCCCCCCCCCGRLWRCLLLGKGSQLNQVGFQRTEASTQRVGHLFGIAGAVTAQGELVLVGPSAGARGTLERSQFVLFRIGILGIVAGRAPQILAIEVQLWCTPLAFHLKDRATVLLGVRCVRRSCCWCHLAKCLLVGSRYDHAGGHAFAIDADMLRLLIVERLRQTLAHRLDAARRLDRHNVHPIMQQLRAGKVCYTLATWIHSPWTHLLVVNEARQLGEANADTGALQ